MVRRRFRGWWSHRVCDWRRFGLLYVSRYTQMSETTDQTTRTITIHQKATNGHHLTVADVLMFADELRKSGAPKGQIVNTDRSPETLHTTSISVFWNPPT